MTNSFICRIGNISFLLNHHCCFFSGYKEIFLICHIFMIKYYKCSNMQFTTYTPNVITYYTIHIENYLHCVLCIVAIGNPKRHVRKASHRDSKQQ